MSTWFFLTFCVMLHLFQSTLESRLHPDLQGTLWHQGKDAKAKRKKKKKGKMTSAKLSLWLSGRPLTSVCQWKAEVEHGDTAGCRSTQSIAVDTADRTSLWLTRANKGENGQSLLPRWLCGSLVTFLGQSLGSSHWVCKMDLMSITLEKKMPGLYTDTGLLIQGAQAAVEMEWMHSCNPQSPV